MLTSSRRCEQKDQLLSEYLAAVQTHSGGLMSGLKRMFGGETLFRNTFTAQGAHGEVLFAPPLCGDMAVLEVGPRQWCVQNSAYVASSPAVTVETKGGAFKGFFSGAGFFVLGTSGDGQMLIGSFGALEAIDVKSAMVIDTGHIVAWETSLTYQVTKAGAGWVASLLSGEGLVCTFSGTGTVYIQSRNAGEYGQNVGAMLPARSA